MADINGVNSTVQNIGHIIANPVTTSPSSGVNDFKTLFHRMYLLNRDLNQGIIEVARGNKQTMTIAGIGDLDPTNSMGQFVLTTTLGEYENIVSAASNLMDAQRKIEDYLQKIV